MPTSYLTQLSRFEGREEGLHFTPATLPHRTAFNRPLPSARSAIRPNINVRIPPRHPCKLKHEAPKGRLGPLTGPVSPEYQLPAQLQGNRGRQVDFDRGRFQPRGQPFDDLRCHGGTEVRASHPLGT
jgi:hypothetical protein